MAQEVVGLLECVDIQVGQRQVSVQASGPFDLVPHDGLTHAAPVGAREMVKMRALKLALCALAFARRLLPIAPCPLAVDSGLRAGGSGLRAGGSGLGARSRREL